MLNVWYVTYTYIFFFGTIFSEPIQSRCAVLRYSKLTDAQVLARLLEVCQQEHVSYADDGLEAIIFTAQGDMRQVDDLDQRKRQHTVDDWHDMWMLTISSKLPIVTFISQVSNSLL